MRLSALTALSPRRGARPSGRDRPREYPRVRRVPHVALLLASPRISGVALMTSSDSLVAMSPSRPIPASPATRSGRSVSQRSLPSLPSSAAASAASARSARRSSTPLVTDPRPRRECGRPWARGHDVRRRPLRRPGGPPDLGTSRCDRGGTRLARNPRADLDRCLGEPRLERLSRTRQSDEPSASAQRQGSLRGGGATPPWSTRRWSPLKSIVARPGEISERET